MARPQPPLREPDDYEGVAADLAEFGVVYIRDDNTPPEEEYPVLRSVN
jgi:hypothetical protein